MQTDRTTKALLALIAIDLFVKHTQQTTHSPSHDNPDNAAARGGLHRRTTELQYDHFVSRQRGQTISNIGSPTATTRISNGSPILQ